jgi:hypothetical protein
MTRAACAANLQKIADLLKHSWAFLIAIDNATHPAFHQGVVIYSIFMDVQFQ